MKHKMLVALLVLLMVALVAVAYAGRPQPQPVNQTVKMPRTEQIKRGEYLVTIGGCHDCHTPWIIQPDGNPGPDMSRALSGHPASFPITDPAQLTSDRYAVAIAATNTAFSGPWGVSFARNLTPDRMTGIGIWSFDIFKNTIRSGRHWGVSRPILPPMPWFNYRHMTDEDLKAVYVYLRTLPPVENEVPEPLPPRAN